MSSKLLFLSAADVDRALSMSTAITAVREAFIDLSQGEGRGAAADADRARR